MGVSRFVSGCEFEGRKNLARWGRRIGMTGGSRVCDEFLYLEFYVCMNINCSFIYLVR